MENEEKTSESGGSIRIISIKSEIDTIYLWSSYQREHSNINDCLNSFTTEPTTSLFNYLISFNVALFCNSFEQTISEDNCGTVTTTHSSHAITVSLPLSEQYQNQECSALNEEEWEIVGSGFSLKQRLPHWGNTTAVVFPKQLELSVISCTHSALTPSGIRLTYIFLKLAQGLLAWSWYSFSVFFCFHFMYYTFILKFFITVRL